MSAHCPAGGLPVTCRLRFLPACLRACLPACSSAANWISTPPSCRLGQAAAPASGRSEGRASARIARSHRAGGAYNAQVLGLLACQALSLGHERLPPLCCPAPPLLLCAPMLQDFVFDEAEAESGRGRTTLM